MIADTTERGVVLSWHFRYLRLFTLLSCLGVCPATTLAQLSTEDHLAEPGFWPTRDFASRDGFVGAQACYPCHAAKIMSQQKTPMGQTAMSAAMADILHSHPALSFKFENYQYRIDTRSGQSMYSITNGEDKIVYPLLWAFGTGRVAQSFLFKKQDGGFYEARATYFTQLGNLDFTPARALLHPSTLEEAMYRPVALAEVQRCFACHSTASTIAGKFDEQHLIPGVSCEACHGPGANHVKAIDDLLAIDSARTKNTIFNPAHLAPSDAVDFCGACHGSWWDVKLAGVKGVSTTRSAPYRLVTSKCWGKSGDVRLTCAACHDPHKQLQTEAAAYDKKCLSCHALSLSAAGAAAHPAAACPEATSQCTTCHMPKINVPEMHAAFTDHRIRIVKPGEPFPE